MVSTWFPHRLSFIARAVLSVGRSRTIAKHTGFRVFLWVGSSCWEEVTLFHCKSCAFIRSKPHYCQTHWFQRGFLWVGSSCWEEVALFHCKSCALSRSKPHYCQTHWFQRFFLGWLLVLGRGGFFHCKSCAFSRSKPHYCQTPWFQRFFGSR